MTIAYSPEVITHYKQTRQNALNFLADEYSDRGGERDSFMIVFSSLSAGDRSDEILAQLQDIVAVFSAGSERAEKVEDFFMTGVGLRECDDICVGCGFPEEAAGDPEGNFMMYCFTCHYTEIKYGVPEMPKKEER